LIEDRQLRERLGAAARHTIEKSYTDVEIARRSADYYTQVLKKNAGLPLEDRSGEEQVASAGERI